MTSEIATDTGLDRVSSDSTHVTPHLRLVPPPTAEAERKEVALRGLVAEPLDIDLQWLLHDGDSVMGARGTLAGVISQIERGSVGGTGNLDEAGCYSHPYTDLHLALGSTAGIGAVERHRWLSAAWRQLSPEMQMVLVIRHSAPRAECRSDSGYGAKDKYIKVADGASAAVAARTATGQIGNEGAIEHNQANAERRSREARNTGVEGFLGDFAALCFELCADVGKLLLACAEPKPNLHRKDGTVAMNKDGSPLINRSLEAERRQLRAAVLKLARAADAAAHRAWAACKIAAKSVRTVLERSGVARPEKQAVVHAPQKPTQRQASAEAAIDSRFAEAVRAYLVESGWTPSERRRKLVVLEAPVADVGTRLALSAGASQASGGAGQRGLLGLLNEHADEAL